MTDSPPPDPLDRLIEDLKLQIELIPEGISARPLQAQLVALERHRDQKLAAEAQDEEA